MKILLCHNFYRLPGGEDHVYRDEGWLLEQHGHEVIRFERDNHSIVDSDRFKAGLMKTVWNQGSTAGKTVWNRESYGQLKQIIQDRRPNLVHFHNTFPLISPSGYYAAQRAGVPVVQTMHNFRTICPSSTLLRDNAVCEKCIGKTFAWPSVMHKCYRNSRRASAVTAVSAGIHRLRGTWDHCIDRYIALTNHSRERFIAAGLQPERVSVKPNFVRPDPGAIPSTGDEAVFVGRLSIEKGIDTLLAAWEMLDRRVPLKIIGDGPLREKVVAAQRCSDTIQWLGQLPHDQVLAEVGKARMLICPSIWYETFGRTMIEAFATGTPVIASDIGSMRELVTHGKTGLHFRAGDPDDLAAQVETLFGDQQRFGEICRAAREEFELKYTADRNYDILMNIYHQAIAHRV